MADDEWMKDLSPEARLGFKNLMLVKDVEIERQRSKTWQKLAGHYDEIRDWLRMCDDDQEGWQEFYKQTCLLIFGEYHDSLPDVEDDECVLMSVGYHIQIPQEIALRRRTMGVYGLRPEPDHHAHDRRTAWSANLATYAKRFHDTMRVQPQPVSEDFVGFDTYWVVVYARFGHVVGEEIEAGRKYLEAEGYHVSSISLAYDPPMA